MPTSSYKYSRSFTLDGKRYFVKGNSEAKVNKKIADKKKSLLQGNEITCDQWFKTYLTYKENVANKTLNDYKNFYYKNISPAIGKRPLVAIKQIDCQGIMNSLQGYSTSYVHKVHITLNGMFEKALDNDLILKNPAKGIIDPKSSQGERRALTREERIIIQRLSPKIALFCHIIYYCGLRPSEVNRIQGKDILGNVLQVQGTKTKSSKRIVPIPDKLKLPNLKPDEYLFNYSRSEIETLWRNIKKNFGETDLTMYCLRHDYCTRLQEAGVPIDVARRLMGHSSISITSKIYTHSNQKSFDEAIKLINSYEG